MGDQIFANALDFHESAQRCFENREQNGRSNFPVMPGIVGLAFACELYLKALFVMETGQPKAAGTHRLNVLFGKLTDKSREAIIERYSYRRRGVGGLDLMADLLTFSNAFVEFRYVYEQKSAEIDVTGLAQLTSSLYEAILQMRPDLQAPQYEHARLTAAAQGLPMFGGIAARPIRPAEDGGRRE